MGRYANVRVYNATNWSKKLRKNVVECYPLAQFAAFGDKILCLVSTAEGMDHQNWPDAEELDESMGEPILKDYFRI